MIFVLIAASTDSLYAVLADKVRPFFAKRSNAGRIGKYVSGSAFIGLGLFTALSGQHAK